MTQKKQLKQSSNRRWWFALHGWCALPVWGVLLLVCVTGTLCVVSQEITWLYKPEVRVDSQGKPPRFDLIQAAVLQYEPTSLLEAVRIDEPYLAYRIRIRLLGGERKTLYVNQYSGVVQGEATGLGFREFILALHGWLLMPWQGDYSVGWYMITLLSLPLLGALMSALFMQKHFWRSFFQPKIRVDKGARVFLGDIHKLIGIWSIWFIAVISFSGLWFLFQGILSHNQIAIFPEPPKVGSPSTLSAPVMTLSHIAARAHSEMPDLRIKHIQFAVGGQDPITVQGLRSGSIFRENVHALYFNPSSGALLAKDHPATVALLHAVVAFVTPLHFGNFAGLTSKLVWFVFGCMLSTLIGSGFWVWYRRLFGRTKKRSIRRAKKHNVTLGRRLETAKWRGFTFLSWLIVVLPLYYFLK